MLQGILSDLHDFHTKQQRWLSLQERFFWEIAPNEFKMSLALSEQLTASSLNINTYKGFKNNIEKMLDSYKDKLGQNEQTPEAFKVISLEYYLILVTKLILIGRDTNTIRENQRRTNRRREFGAKVSDFDECT